MHEKMSNVRRQMEILRKYQKKMLEVKKKIALMEMNNVFHKLISRVATAKEILREIEDM